MSPEKKQQIADVIKSFGDSGATALQVAEVIGVHASGVRRQICELRDNGELVVVARITRNKTPVYALRGAALLDDGADVFEQCRQNWQGYSIHKIFGSAQRAPA